MRWSPNGDMIASASEDKTVQVLDFKTGKVIHTGKTSDGSNNFSILIVIILNFMIRFCLFSLLHLSENKIKRGSATKIINELWVIEEN